jgi:hypothetical protein
VCEREREREREREEDEEEDFLETLLGETLQLQ